MSGYHLNYTAEQIDNLLGSTDEHCACHTNPHGVTAEQVGAYTTTQVDNQVGIALTTMGTECKNLLQNGCQSREYAGVTCTVNADGSITLNGTNTNSVAYGVYYTNMRTGATDLANQYDNYLLLPSGNYIISGGIEGKTDFQVFFSSTENTESTYIKLGAGGSFTVPEGTLYVWVRFRIAKGSVFDNETVYPMIRRAEISDDTYVPYKPTLQQQIDEIRDMLTSMLTANEEV